MKTKTMGKKVIAIMVMLTLMLGSMVTMTSAYSINYNIYNEYPQDEINDAKSHEESKKIEDKWREELYYSLLHATNYNRFSNIDKHNSIDDALYTIFPTSSPYNISVRKNNVRINWWRFTKKRVYTTSGEFYTMNNKKVLITIGVAGRDTNRYSGDKMGFKGDGYDKKFSDCIGSSKKVVKRVWVGINKNKCKIKFKPKRGKIYWVEIRAVDSKKRIFPQPKAYTLFMR